MITWGVKRKGKIERLIIFYMGLTVFSAIVYVVVALMSHIRYSYIEFMLSTSIFWIPIALIALYRISKSKIAKEISIHNDKLTISFKKNVTVEIPLKDLAYAVTDVHKSHVGLTFFKKFKGSRGQDVFQKVTELIGRKLTVAWKKRDLLDIKDTLDELNVTQTQAENRDLPLWERILSN